MNTNFKVISLTRLGMKPESTAPDTDALTTWPSEQLLKRTKANRKELCGAAEYPELLQVKKK